MILQLVGLIVRFAPALLAVSVACNLWIGVRLVATKIELASVKSDLAETMAEHAAMVAKAERERAEASERYRQLERQMTAENELLAERLKEQRHALEAANADSRVAAGRLRIALDTIAELAGRAAEDPATAERAARACAATVDVLGEADAAAGELAEEAGRLASIVLGLQHYVRNVCTAKPAPGP